MAKLNPVSVHNERDEYKQVRKDLIFVLVLNALLFAGLIALYFVNRSSGIVDRFFSNLLKF